MFYFWSSIAVFFYVGFLFLYQVYVQYHDLGFIWCQAGFYVWGYDMGFMFGIMTWVLHMLPIGPQALPSLLL